MQTPKPCMCTGLVSAWGAHTDPKAMHHGPNLCLGCHAATPETCMVGALISVWNVTWSPVSCPMGSLIFARGGGGSNIGLQGVIVAFRVVDGSLRKGDTVRLMNTKKEYQVDEVGVRSPTPIEVCSSCCLSLLALP